MKAVIMAGGEGSRLRPLTLGLPKPMVPLFDRPVMAHIIDLLKGHGITDICVTLQYMPQVVTDWFGDGAELGVTLRYFVEEEPLGTAGSVKNCMDALGEEDFLVISGDAVCDLDLSAALGVHRASRSEATLVLVRHPAPLEYGLVLLRDDGRVERFIEKPGWGQVFTSTVNTGIYVLTKKAMDRVPAGQVCDFGRDLFPQLLAEGAPLYGHVAQGYWCDMGDCAAYLACAADALGGKVRLDHGLEEVAPGVWSASPLPPSVSLVPPCWIGAQVSIGAGSLIGPHVMLGRGSAVGRRSLVQRSMLLENARVDDGATLYGAVLGRDAWVRRGAVLNEGTVLGAGSRAGEDAVLLDGVKLWPGREAPQGGRLTASLVEGGSPGSLRFGDGGVIRGIFHQDVGPEGMLTLGGVLGAEGKVGLGWAGGPEAELLARAAACGVAAAGSDALLHDGGCAAAGAWLARRYQLPVSLFLEQEGERLFLHLFDRRGLPLGRSRERRLEGALLRGELRRAHRGQVGRWECLTDIPDACARDGAAQVCLNRGGMSPVAVAAPGGSPADGLLAQTLEELGCVVLRRETPGVPCFWAEYGGLRLRARDERGADLEPDQLLALVCLVELEQGEGRVAVPWNAPAAIDRLGREGQVLRLGRDGEEAEALYQRQSWLWDAAQAAARICARMGLTGERLSALAAKGAGFVRLRREVPLRRGRGEVMQALAGTGEQLDQGVRVAGGSGWVYLAPLSRRAALRVVAEAADMEAAQALCEHYVRRTQEIDGTT